MPTPERGDTKRFVPPRTDEVRQLAVGLHRELKARIQALGTNPPSLVELLDLGNALPLARIVDLGAPRLARPGEQKVILPFEEGVQVPAHLVVRGASPRDTVMVSQPRVVVVNQIGDRYQVAGEPANPGFHGNDTYTFSIRKDEISWLGFDPRLGSNGVASSQPRTVSLRRGEEEEAPDMTVSIGARLLNRGVNDLIAGLRAVASPQTS